MKKVFWLLTGIAAGLVIAKQLDENPKAQAVVDDAAQRAKEFGTAIAEGFREREIELTKSAQPAASKPASNAAVKKAAAKKATTAKKTVSKQAPAKATPKQSTAKPTVTA